MSRRAHPTGLLVGIVVLLAVAVAACGIPTSGGPTAISKKDVPFQLLSPATPSTTESTVPATVLVPEPIFLVAVATQTVAPVTRNVAVSATLNATLTEVLNKLLDGPTTDESASGLQSYLNPETKTEVSARVTNGVATVDFTTNPFSLVGTNQTLAVAQVVFTATEQQGVTGVLFQIAGQPIEVPTASGATVPGPVDRTAYQAQAPVP